MSTSSLNSGDGSERAATTPGARHEIKRWSAGQWVVLCGKLTAAGHDVLLVGDRTDTPIGNEIEKRLRSPHLSSRIGTARLSETAEIISRARLFIDLDTGLAHLAAHYRTPAVVVFSGHADADVWAPFGPQAVSMRTETPCSPCGAQRLRQCPFGHRRMTSITAEHVWTLVEPIVSGGPLPRAKMRFSS